MNRRITNAIRYVLDEWVPPAIRDNRYFMLPFFLVWFKGKNIAEHMDFKRLVYGWSDDELSAFYRRRDSLATDRVTDLSEPCIQRMIELLPRGAQRILDVGCGNGYLLQRLADVTDAELHGLDYNKPSLPQELQGRVQLHEGSINHLPFEDRTFDVVVCSHVLEHLPDPWRAVSELTRVASKQLQVVVPRQRPFYFTLDEHVNFYPIQEPLVHLMAIDDHRCERIWGDWLYVGWVPGPS